MLTLGYSRDLNFHQISGLVIILVYYYRVIRSILGFSLGKSNDYIHQVEHKYLALVFPALL